MTTYYVSPSGSDSNNGLGPDQSHGTNRPWITIGKALGASGIASGDTVYIGPGTYREVVTVNMTSATVETLVLGDPGNAQGFKNGSGVLLAPADIVWTASLTNDWTTPSSTTLLTLNGRDFLTFQFITFVGSNSGTATCITAAATNSLNITVRDCTLISPVAGAAIVYTGLADIASNWLIDRCIFMFGTRAVGVTLPIGATVDYDSNFVIQNCLIMLTQTNGVNIAASGSGTGLGGGVDILNCTFLQTSTAVTVSTGSISTSIPCTVYNCVLTSGGFAPLNANTNGNIVSDYCWIWNSAQANTNVTNGSNTKTAPNASPLFEIGQAGLYGRMARSFMMPAAGSPVLGFGNKTSPGGNTLPTVDSLNRPRPAGGGAATTAAAVTGTATAGAATTMTDGGASWTVNAFAGYKVKLTGGTGSGQERLISSNTGTVLTIAPAWGTNPDGTSTYSIYQPGVDYVVGYLERHDPTTQETSVTQAASSAAKIIGPGDHDFVLPVDASSTTFTIYARYDSNHGTGSKPQVILLANGAIGVTTETKTMTAAADTWEQLTFAAQTPTAKGFVTLRLVSRSAAGNGIAYFDTASGGASSTAGFDYFRQGEPIPALVASAGGGGGGGIFHSGVFGD